MKYVKKIEVEGELADTLQEILDLSDYWDECEQDGVIETFTAKFDNDFEADIKVCNGEGPYVDPVLFDQIGMEIEIAEAGDILLGEYTFYHNGDSYHVHVMKQRKKDRRKSW